MSRAYDTGEDGVEWEYEYDDNETEDFYFTLDLTTHVSNAVAAPEPRKRNRAAPKGKRRPETPAEQAAREERDAAVSAVVTAARLPSLPATGADGEEPNPPGTQEAKLQILDLHSENPFVKFIDGVYSCNWHTDLSTQVYVAKPGGVTETPVLRPGTVVDVVGLSRNRLVGKPVTLQPRPKPVVVVEPAALGGGGEDNPTSSSSPNTLSHTAVPPSTTTTTSPAPPHPAAGAVPPPSSSGGTDSTHIRPGDPLIIPRDRVRTEAMEHQAVFLEQLAAIKLRRGETDLVPVSGVRFYDAPADREGIRARALAAVEDGREGDGGGGGGSGDARARLAKRRRVEGREGAGDREEDEGDDDEEDDGDGGGDGGGLRFYNQTVESFSSRPKTKRSSIDEGHQLSAQQHLEQQQEQEKEQQAQPGASSTA
ncbi:hypothetical protein NU219Hw_g5087t1 [Hortaea werneckii]